MEKLRNRMAYMQGMADGLGLNGNSKEGKMLVEMMCFMDDLVAKMESMDDRLEEQEEYTEAIDEDLTDLEEYVEAIDEDLDDVEDFLFWDDEEGEYLDDDFEDNEVDMDEEDLIYFDEEDEDDDEIIMVDGIYDEMDEGYDDDEEGFFEIECPTCQELVAVDQDIFEDDMVAEVLCPECHEVILVNDDVEDRDEFENYVVDERY